MRRIVFIVVWILCAVTLHAQREFYEHYASREDLVVAYAHGYRLDSNNRVDVVLIQATDSASWVWMQEEFSIEPPDTAHLGMGGDVKHIRIVDRLDPRIQLPSNVATEPAERVCVLTCSRKERYICVFFTVNHTQVKILHLNYINSLNQ